MSRIGIITESGKDIGYGHLYREIAIAESFLSKGCQVTFFCNEDVDQLLINKLPEVSINKWNQLDEEFSKYDIIAFDVYKESFERFRDIIRKCETNNITTVTVVDFIFKEYALNTDFVFQIGYQSYSNEKTEKKEDHKNVVYYSGSDFLVFRKEFDNVKPYEPKRKADKLLVAMGGSDPHCLSELVNQSLSFIKIPLTVTYIYGNGFEHDRIYLLKRENEGSHHKFYYYQNVEDMPSLILKHDLAIINGGNTRFEIGKLGIPFISIAFQQVQKELSDLIADDGIGVSLGLYSELKKEQIADVIENILSNYKMRRKQSKKMQNIFGENGSDKICQILLN